MECNPQNMIMNDFGIINIQNDLGVLVGDALPIVEDPTVEQVSPIVEVENESHDCVIDIADSQSEDELLSATIALTPSNLTPSLEDSVLAPSNLTPSLEDSVLAPPFPKVEKVGKVQMGTAKKDLGKGQDAPYCGSFVDDFGNKGHYVALYDGHGGNECIDAIRSFNQDEIMGATDPVDCVREKIRDYRTQKKCNMAHSGSTFVYAKIITENSSNGFGIGYISIGNVADSELAVYINGERVFMTTPQIAQTPGELDRLTREGRVYTHKKNLENKPKIHTDNKITMERAYNINFIGMNPIVPTQSLGHNELTGYAPELKVITFDLKKDTVRIVAA